MQPARGGRGGKQRRGDPRLPGRERHRHGRRAGGDLQAHSPPDPQPGGYIPLASNLTISGAGQDATIIDGNKTDRVFGSASSVAVTLEKLTVANGVSSVANTLEPAKSYGTPGIKGADGTDGGGILNTGTMTLSSVTVRDNATGGGGLGGTSFGNASTTGATAGPGTGGAGGKAATAAATPTAAR